METVRNAGHWFVVCLLSTTLLLRAVVTVSSNGVTRAFHLAPSWLQVIILGALVGCLASLGIFLVFLSLVGFHGVRSAWVPALLALAMLYAGTRRSLREVVYLSTGLAPGLALVVWPEFAALPLPGLWLPLASLLPVSLCYVLGREEADGPAGLRAWVAHSLADRLAQLADAIRETPGEGRVVDVSDEVLESAELIEATPAELAALVPVAGAGDTFLRPEAQAVVPAATIPAPSLDLDIVFDDEPASGTPILPVHETSLADCLSSVAPHAWPGLRLRSSGKGLAQSPETGFHAVSLASREIDVDEFTLNLTRWTSLVAKQLQAERRAAQVLRKAA